MNLHFLGAGDVVLSLGTRTHIGQLLTHVGRRATLASVSFFQFRSAGMPPPEADGGFAVEGFPCRVHCPTRPRQYERLPRPVFRLIERVRLWGFFRNRMAAIPPGDQLMVHGCLGALYLCGHARIPLRDRMWLKLGLLEEEDGRGIRYRVRKRVERMNARAFGRRVAVSREMLGFLDRQYGPSGQPDVVLPCLYDADRFAPDADRMEARRRLGFGDRVVFVYLGIGAPWQCPAETVALFREIKRRLPAAYLWVVTPDRDVFSRLLAGVASGDYRIEHCPHHRLAERLPAADFGFLLRKRGLINRVASPVKLPEYLACGLPVVIGPEVGDYTALVKGHRLGTVVDPEAPLSWGPAIDWLVTQAPPGAGLRLRAKAAAESLSWQSRVDSLLAVAEG
jgi:glycosyltransferase involved in cell wall biosynthesis